MDFTSIIQKIIIDYNSFGSSIPNWVKQFILLFFFVIITVFYAVVIWKFYRFISKKNIIGLNLNQYNNSSNIFLSKFFKVVLYFVEYILILPLLVFFWFSLFSIFLLLLTRDVDLNKILIISAVIVASIRATSYYKEDLSRDLAKLLPFTILGLAITSSNFFSVDKILGSLERLPGLFSDILIYLLFIIFLELVLRFFDILFYSLNQSAKKTNDSTVIETNQ